MPASGPSEKSRGTDCVDFSKWIFMIRILEYRGVKRKTEMILFSAFCGNLNPIFFIPALYSYIIKENGQNINREKHS